MPVHQPLWLRSEEVPELPHGWISLRTSEACEQLEIGRRYDTKTVSDIGSVPVLNQSKSGFIGFHNNEPGIVATPDQPVVTFANHTCCMRLMKTPFSCIQNIFPKVGKAGVSDTIYFYYAAQGRVDIADYKGHHPLFRQAIIPCPPMPTQCRIASILSAYDDLIENNMRRIEILEEMAQSLYREWFVKFRFPGHEKVRMVESPLGQIPEGWDIGRLDDALVLQRGFDLPKAKRQPGDVPVFASTGVTGTHDVAKVRSLGVVTGRSGSLGTVILVQEDFWPLNTALWVKEFKRSTPLFAYYLLSSLDLAQFDSGAAVPTLNRNDVHGLAVVLPTDADLEAFDNHALPLHRLARILRQQNSILRRTRDFLLPKLISGELDVSELDAPVPEAVA